jgi:glycine/D-amino acid oxidase-like deaminating enzyme
MLKAAAASDYRTGALDVTYSGWTSYPGKALGFDRLEGDHKADVLVVGAGLAGSSVALHLAEAGANVILVEAQEPGWGASGRNAGHVVTHRETLGAIRRLPDQGEAFLSMWRRDLHLTFELAERLGIDCDAKRGGYMKVATSERKVAAAHKHAETYAALGLPVRFADRDEVAHFTGSDAYHAGALDEAGGRINPWHFTRGLADGVRKAGGQVFAQSPVKALTRQGAAWRARTDGGSAAADRVVMCTGGYGAIEGLPLLTATWCPLLAYVIASEPIRQEERRHILPSGGICAELPHGFNPFLIDGLGRMFCASLPSTRAEDWQGIAAKHRRWRDRVFPGLAGQRFGIDSYWTGMLAYSPDELPAFHELGPGLIALNGFSSEGNVPAPMLGKNLAEAIIANRFDQLALPLRPAESVRWRNRYEFILRRILVPLQDLALRFTPSSGVARS